VLKVDAVSGVGVSGLVYSTDQRVVVTYSYQPTYALPKDIRIR